MENKINGKKITKGTRKEIDAKEENITRCQKRIQRDYWRKEKERREGKRRD